MSILNLNKTLRPQWVAVVLFLASSLPAQAQDYYTPVKKELEPLARFPLTAFAMSDDRLSYTLPLDLTGVPVAMDLTRVPSSIEGMRLYQGERASASCMGSDSLPACVIQHRSLPVDRTRVSEFLGRKYLDIKLRDDAQRVADSFSSGNEPIGFISRRTLPDAAPLPQSWITSFNGVSAGKPFSISPVPMQWNGDRGSFQLPSGVIGSIEALFIDGGHISATWRTPSDSGWLDLQIASDRRSFHGSWGRSQGQPALGQWTGKAR